MKSHVTRGAEILKDFTIVEHAIDGTLYHHEIYDGSGYPQGLSGEAIPLYGRIIGVADAFDAMTANRVYRKKLENNYGGRVPTATMDVRYTYTWTNYILEKQCAEALIADGCVILGQHSDTIGPAVACEEAMERLEKGKINMFQGDYVGVDPFDPNDVIRIKE